MAEAKRPVRPEDALIEAVLDAHGITPVYRFGRFVLDIEDERLTKDGVPVLLPPKEFQTLCCLVAARGRLVTKAHLLARVWAGVNVNEGTIAHRICALRKVLGHDDEGNELIETVPRRGYRLVLTSSSRR